MQRVYVVSTSYKNKMTRDLTTPGYVIWFCGLPGSGKSTIAQLVLETLNSKYSARLEYVSMDQIRRKIYPEPKYDDAERDSAYRSLVLIGSLLARNGINVILDGTGHKVAWRDFARSECEKFIEVYLKCPIEVCIERENRRERLDGIRSRLYSDAMERIRSGQRFQGLGKVPGVDEPFEESDSPEVMVDSSVTPEGAAQNVMKQLLLIAPEIFHKI